MPTYLTPGVYVEEVPSANKPIEGVSTSVAAFVGLTPGGPVNTPMRISNWTQFAKIFGDPIEPGQRALHGGRLHGPLRVRVLPERRHELLDRARRRGDRRAAPRAAGRASGGGRQVASRRSAPRRSRTSTARVEVELTEEPKAGEGDPTYKLVVTSGSESEEYDGLTLKKGRNNLATKVNAVLEADQDRGDRRVAARGAARPGHRQVHAVGAGAGAVRRQAGHFSGDEAKRQGMGGLGRHRRGDDGPDARPLDLGDDTQVRDLQGKMIAHCENLGDRMAILDAPPDLLPQEILEWRMNTAGYDSKMSALYYPWIEVMDPLTNRPINIPPSGHVAGLWCRVDESRGVHKAPANEVVMGANGLAFQVTHAEQGGLNKVGINCIRAFPGRGIRVWGARTLSSDPEWRYINVRRLFNYISESIMAGTQWSVFEPNDEFLWLQLRNAVSSFLTRTWRSGALFGNSTSQAFFVKCDAETNPPEVIEAGQVVCEVGVAPVKPAEFVIFRLSQFSGGGGAEVSE